MSCRMAIAKRPMAKPNTRIETPVRIQARKVRSFARWSLARLEFSLPLDFNSGIHPRRIKSSVRQKAILRPFRALRSFRLFIYRERYSGPRRPLRQPAVPPLLLNKTRPNFIVWPLSKLPPVVNGLQWRLGAAYQR